MKHERAAEVRLCIWLSLRESRRHAPLLWAACGCLAGLLAASCGGKKPPPLHPPTVSAPPGEAPQQPPATVSEGPAPQTKSATTSGKKDTLTVRVLLRENFDSVRIEGATLASPLRVEFRAGRIILRKGRQPTGEVLAAGSGFRLEPPPRGLLRIEGAGYRGALEAFVNPLGAGVVVNEVDLEDYLRGVLPNELHPTRFPHLEALKAQCVAARTFAVFHLGSFARRGFDLYADERSQLYKGVAGEHDLSDQAVKKTSGLVVTHRRKPILALYSSTCGGMTDSYSAVFQKEGFPYLKGGAKCDDRDSPFHSWEERVPSARVTANLKGKPPIGDLRKIEPLKRGVSGRVVEMRLTGSRGQTVLKGNEVRFVLGLRSNLITTVKAIRDKRGNVKELRVKGKGWGHGVGLCQYGAVNLAAKGVKFEGILKHYYRDVSITRQ